MSFISESDPFAQFKAIQREAWAGFAKGVNACPATAWLLRRWFHVELSGRAQVIAAASFFVAGRIALLFGTPVAVPKFPALP